MEWAGGEHSILLNNKELTSTAKWKVSIDV